MTLFRFSKQMRERWLVMAGVFVLSFTLPVVAMAQVGDTNARLSRMERDIETLSRSVYKGEKIPSGALNVGSGSQAYQEQTDARMTQLENDLRDLTGRVEEQGNTLNQINRTLSDIQMRLAGLEGKSLITSADSTITMDKPTAEPAENILTDGPNGPASTMAPSVGSIGNLPQTDASDSDPARAYENAIALLKQRDYGLAEKSFQDFLKNNPSHALTPNAKYWLGEAYFAQNKYEQAARVFAEGYQQYPKGAKAADNLLKLGLSLSALNNKEDACVALTQIAKDFPNGAAAVRTRAESEVRKLKCGG